MYVRRQLIKISENIIDNAKVNDLNVSGQTIIEDSEKILYDLAEKGSFSSTLIKFDLSPINKDISRKIIANVKKIKSFRCFR